MEAVGRLLLWLDALETNFDLRSLSSLSALGGEGLSIPNLLIYVDRSLLAEYLVIGLKCVSLFEMTVICGTTVLMGVIPSIS